MCVRYAPDSTRLCHPERTFAVHRPVRTHHDGGVRLGGVRLDSGDLGALSKDVHEIVGDAGIVVSSSVDEYFFGEFFADGGVATAFGPGTALTTSKDAPDSGVVYKLTAVGRDRAVSPRMKLSPGKVTYPGPKSLYRVERDGSYRYDVLARRGEELEGTPLLETVYEDGTLVYDPPSLQSIRKRARRSLEALPERHRRIRDPDRYQVRISDGLEAITRDTKREIRKRER
ncbi:hypothetical protein [Natrononativus amylolyticus]|uniref:hypothetical protein n=1 Tax=Natrononativus amylolyticus TaxID=2963434 RepID=UPI0020CEFB24|nr:hypothetical protein [Natrononativus amylolyticus]